ncbi:pseudouridine synthase family protein [Shewanella gaetbuli]|uniref:RluA family pseudouridine synthase n=1 Tax=Shewanella gaetbuli TaxID=220752 RepID=A0A9X1ZMV6_9GAMM|nr:RluA family pseudouridine synthase [Shewanella gaetbuli]MCL1142405.1 RluA family pseudouridine synthase [Shewanella gaetbuli]
MPDTSQINTTVIECHVDVCSPENNAVELLATESGLSKQLIKQAMQKGAVWHSHGKQVNRLRRAKKALAVGDKVHLYYNDHILAEVPATAQMLFDQQQYSLWYKPYGLRCQPSKWSDHTTINRFVELNTQPPRNAYIIHRLDRAASGLIILGHTKKATAALAKLFQTRALDKYYQVIVHGQFPTTQVTINTDVDNKPALSHADLLEYNPQLNQSRVQVKIESGRKHQIRIHMNSIGFPVVGDRLHGNAAADAPDLKLCCCKFEFLCPITQQKMIFNLPQSLQPKF